MTRNKKLAIEAEKKLNELENGLKKITGNSSKLQKNISRYILLPMLALPFGLGYLLFKKSSLKTPSAIPNIKNKLPKIGQHILPGKDVKNKLLPWLPHVAKEALMMTLGNWLTKFFTKKKQ